MKRRTMIIIAVLAAFVALLLFVDIHAAYTTDTADSEHTTSRSKFTTGPVGDTLEVYITGEPALARALKERLPEALQSKELPLKVRFVDQVPADAYANPFLAIRVDEDDGLWTPVYATRNVKATLLFWQGRPVNAQLVLAPQPDYAPHFTRETCVGECSELTGTVKLRATAAGLVSLPQVRSYVAAKVAAQAAAVVIDGLPESLNPAKMASRAHTLAREDAQGSSSVFQRMPGCWGGVVMAEGSQWAFMYYDAVRDSITDKVTLAEVEAKTPVPFPAAEVHNQFIMVGLPNGKSITIPKGSCGLTGWRVHSN